MPSVPPSRSPMLVGLGLLLVLIIALLQLDFIEFAYERIGVAPQYVFAVLIASLIGSSINIPLSALPAKAAAEGASAAQSAASPTILAINLGGAVIPIALSAYLLVRGAPLVPALLGTAVVAAIVHWLARPIPKVGISVPIFIPPLVAAGAALLLAPANAPAVAYVAGTLGTLIGADLTNLHRLRGLGAPVASIGGAGTFDGIFVTGILAVLLA